jgi:hypothetical protein
MSLKKTRIKTNLFLDAKDYRQLKRIATKTLGHPPVSALIREAIKQFIHTQAKKS